MSPQVYELRGQTRRIISAWPRYSRKLAEVMTDRYGPPSEATPQMVMWQYNGPWKRTQVHREGIPHNFPRPHFDVLSQTVDYRVPLDRYGEIGAFDGSIIIDRTAGEVTARCQTEEMNVLLLNLMHDIATGTIDARKGRALCAKMSNIHRRHWSEPYVQELQFPTNIYALNRETQTSDPDISRRGY
ncbi:MAG: hypothetical protein WD972_00385, partial [Candidatus Andersenbacteria bacterium]